MHHTSNNPSSGSYTALRCGRGVVERVSKLLDDLLLSPDMPLCVPDVLFCKLEMPPGGTTRACTRLKVVLP